MAIQESVEFNPAVVDWDGQYEAAHQTIQAMTREVGSAVHMAKDDLRITIAAAMVGEHVLFEGDPGTGKTTLAKAMAAAMGGKYNRVQGTPDIMPSDITGTNIYNPGTRQFEFLPGPIFSNVFLLDEVNRMPTKSQSALMEPMQERTVTIMGKEYKLEDPFVVLATENPMDVAQGVQPLPNANRDRYAVGVYIPEHIATDMLAVSELADRNYQVQPAVGSIEIVPKIRKIASSVGMNSDLKIRTADLVVKMRQHPDLDPETTVLGGSRPMLNILKIARAVALSNRRQNVEVDDIAFAARYVFPHRLGLGFDAQDAGRTTQQLVKEVVDRSL